MALGTVAAEIDEDGVAGSGALFEGGDFREDALVGGVRVLQAS